MLRDGEELPEIYKDPTFSRTSHWELSTSQLSSPFVDGWGYGEGKRSFSGTYQISTRDSVLLLPFSVARL